MCFPKIYYLYTLTNLTKWPCSMLSNECDYQYKKNVASKKLSNLYAIHLPDTDHVRCNGRGAIVEKVNLGCIIEGKFWINS